MSHNRYAVWFFCIVGIVIISQVAGKWYLTPGFMGNWYDKIQHFLGGSACGVFGAWCYQVLSLSSASHDTKTYNRVTQVCAIVAAIGIGFLWEVYEHLVPAANYGVHLYFSLDTSLDMFFDTLGAYIASCFFRRGPSGFEKKADEFELPK